MADSRLADIYRKELKTKGLLGALVSASGARLKEKTDIRGMLPQTGVSGAAFEKMFGKRYKYGGDKQAVRSSGGSDSAATKSMEEKLTRIGVDGKLTAKNTVVLPAMARDMNLMRMNMQKMVKLSGGTPSTKSDMFFKRASDREAQYEGQYKKNSGGLAPTPVGEKKEGGGFFDMIKGFLGMGIGPLIESILSGLFKAGLLVTILNGIGKYFTDDAFKQSVNAAFDKFFTTVFGEDYKKQLATGAAILVGAVVAMKLAMAGLEAAMFAAARRIAMLGGGPGVPGSPNRTNKGGKGGWLKTLGKGALAAGGVALLTEGVKYYLQQGESEEDAKRLAQEDIDNQTRETLSPGEEIAPKRPEGMRGSEIADRAGSAVNSAITIGTGVALMPSKATSIPSTAASTPSAAGKPLTSFGSVGANREMEKNKTLWEKIAKVMKKAYEKGASKIMLSKLGAKFGTWMAIKMATVAAGVVAAPFSAGASLLISAIGVGMLAKDVYDLYEWFMEYEKELDAFEKSSSPTPVAAEPTNVSPSPAPAAAAATPMKTAATPKMAPGGADKRGGSTSPSAAGSNYGNETSKTGVAESGDAIEALTFFKSKGWSSEQAAGIVANLQAESNFKTNAIGDGGKAYGIAQWHPDRQAVYQKEYGKPIQQANFKEQLEYVNWELNNTEKRAGNLLRKATSADQAATLVDQFYERSSGAHRQKRIDIANSLSGKATQVAAAPSTGTTLTQAQSSLSTQQLAMNSSGGPTVINAPTNNSMMSSPSSSGGNNVNPYNNDLMRYLLRPIA